MVPTVPAAGFLGTEQSMEKRALVISEYTSAQEAFNQCGLKSDVLPSSRLGNIDGSHRYKLLCEHHYCIVWIDLPSPRVATTQVWKLIRLWLSKCQDMYVPAYLVGPRCNAWKGEQPKNFICDRIVRESRHRWCHYGISLARQPSLSEYVVYSTVPVENSPCMCELKTEHAKDWELKETGLRVKKAQSIALFFYKLLRTKLVPMNRSSRDSF